MVKPFDLIKEAKMKINNSNTPQLDAEVILSHVLKKDRIQLFLNRDMELMDEQVAEFWAFIERRSHNEPIAYIIGSREFMGLEFKVREGVLIPRADTEVLVEQVLKRVQCTAPIIVDIGCGSGAIAVSLAHFMKAATIYALDIMDTPIETTIENAMLNHVENSVFVIKSDLLNGLDHNLVGKIDVIVSNPPYIEKQEYEELMQDVKAYEPQSALTDGGDGLDFYRQITRDAAVWLKAGGLLAYEIGYNQREQVIAILEQYKFVNIECIKDLADKDRVIIGYNRRSN